MSIQGEWFICRGDNTNVACERTLQVVERAQAVLLADLR